MKKLLIFFVCFILLCPLLCSCGNRTGGELTEPTQGQSGATEEPYITAADVPKEDETTVPKAEATTRKYDPAKVSETTERVAETELPVPSGKNLKVKYIRDYSGDYEAPTSGVIIRSAEELKARYGNSQGELSELCKEYTEDYFKTGVLLVAVTVESSGSISHKVTGVDNNNGELCVNIKTEKPEVGTCDMAMWQIIVEYPAGNYSKVTVNKK